MSVDPETFATVERAQAREARGAGAASSQPPCPYAKHRSTDWRLSPEHPWVCGVCHPPAVPELVGERAKRWREVTT